jgi:hypothetical protein
MISGRRIKQKVISLYNLYNVQEQKIPMSSSRALRRLALKRRHASSMNLQRLNAASLKI